MVAASLSYAAAYATIVLFWSTTKRRHSFIDKVVAALDALHGKEVEGPSQKMRDERFEERVFLHVSRVTRM